MFPWTFVWNWSFCVRGPFSASPLATTFCLPHTDWPLVPWPYVFFLTCMLQGLLLYGTKTSPFPSPLLHEAVSPPNSWCGFTPLLNGQFEWPWNMYTQPCLLNSCTLISCSCLNSHFRSPWLRDHTLFPFVCPHKAWHTVRAQQWHWVDNEIEWRIQEREEKVSKEVRATRFSILTEGRHPAGLERGRENVRPEDTRQTWDHRPLPVAPHMKLNLKPDSWTEIRSGVRGEGRTFLGAVV